MLECLRC